MVSEHPVVGDLHAINSIINPAFNGVFHFLIFVQMKAFLRIWPVGPLGIIVVYNFAEETFFKFRMDFELFFANCLHAEFLLAFFAAAHPLHSCTHSMVQKASN